MSSAADLAPRSRTQAVRESIRSTDQPVFLYIAFVILAVGFTVANPLFLTPSNWVNILNQTALVTIMAVGVAMVIIGGEIDLSVGSNMALSGVVAALFMRSVSENWILGALVGLGVGILVGFANGFLTVWFRIPSFLVTLGVLSAARGISLIITGTSPVLVTDETFWTVFGDGRILGVSTPIIWTVVVVAAGYFVLQKNIVGRQIYATGGNVDAARYSGVNTNRVKVTIFMISGVLAGLGGLIVAARGHAIRPDVGQGIELDVLAAVILGGVSLFGGKGQIFGVVLGSLIIGILNNGLVLMGIAPSVQLTIKGVLIVVAVAFGRR